MNTLEDEHQSEAVDDRGAPSISSGVQPFAQQSLTTRKRRNFVPTDADAYTWGVRMIAAVLFANLLFVAAIYYGFINP